MAESKHVSWKIEHRLVGEHSARCKAAKHEDWQHGTEVCAVGLCGDPQHCDCTAHWEEVR